MRVVICHIVHGVGHFNMQTMLKLVPEKLMASLKQHVQSREQHKHLMSSPLHDRADLEAEGEAPGGLALPTLRLPPDTQALPMQAADEASKPVSGSGLSSCWLQLAGQAGGRSSSRRLEHVLRAT